MLPPNQENEIIRNPLLDDLTGFPSDEEKNLQDYQKASHDIVRSENIDKMLATEGWGIIQNFLNQAVETHTDQLVFEKDANVMLRLQSLIQALKFLPRLIQELKMDGERAKQILNSFTSDPEFMG